MRKIRGIVSPLLGGDEGDVGVGCLLCIDLGVGFELCVRVVLNRGVVGLVGLCFV